MNSSIRQSRILRQYQIICFLRTPRITSHCTFTTHCTIQHSILWKIIVHRLVRNSIILRNQNVHLHIHKILPLKLRLSQTNTFHTHRICLTYILILYSPSISFRFNGNTVCTSLRFPARNKHSQSRLHCPVSYFIIIICLLAIEQCSLIKHIAKFCSLT